MTLRLALLEDHSRYASALARCLAAAGFEVLAIYASSEDLLAALADRTAPEFELLLCDIGLPGEDGVAALSAIKAQRPAVKVVMLTSIEQPAEILRAIAAGADGYLMKVAEPADTAEQIRAIAAGSAPLSAAVAELLLALARKAPVRRDLGLSAREEEVLAALQEGLSYKEIARRLDIALDTVRNHVRRIYDKLQVKSARAAIAKALAARL